MFEYILALQTEESISFDEACGQLYAQQSEHIHLAENDQQSWAQFVAQLSNASNWFLARLVGIKNNREQAE